TQPLPAGSFIKAVPCNRVAASRHDALFRGATSFFNELFEQAAQIQFRPQFPVPVNRKRTKSGALQMPANDFAPVFPACTALALSAARAALTGRTTAAGSAQQLPTISNSWHPRSIAAREVACALVFNDVQARISSMHVISATHTR